MAVRAGADDIEGLRQRSAGGRVALQDGAERIDFSWGPVGEIGDGAVADLAVLTEALAQEDGGELRLGTTATYMSTLCANNLVNKSRIYTFTWLHNYHKICASHYQQRILYAIKAGTSV